MPSAHAVAGKEQRMQSHSTQRLVLLTTLMLLVGACLAQGESLTARVPRDLTPVAREDLTFTVQILKPQKVTVRIPNRALPGFGGPQFFQDLAGQYTVLQGELVNGELVVTEPGNVVHKPAREKRPKPDCPAGPADGQMSPPAGRRKNRLAHRLPDYQEGAR
jgi:hypothetical protein